MGLEIGRLIGDGPVGGGVALVEAVLGEEHHLLEQRLGHLRLHPPFRGPGHEEALVLLHFALLLLAHRPPQQVGLAKGIAGQILGDLHDLLLIDHDPVGLAQDRLELGVSHIDPLTAVLPVDEFGDQSGIKRARTVESQDRGDVLQR